MRDLSLTPSPQTITLRLRALYRKANRLRVVQVLLLVLYLLAFALLLPIDRLGAQPMLRRDYSYHYSQIVELSDIIAEQGDAWGYSPRFFAGYPIGISSNLGSKGWTWFVYLLSSLSISTVMAYNLFVVLGWVLMPLLIYKAARGFTLSARSATLAAVVAAIYWWGSYPYSFIANWGGASFILSIPFALYGLAAFSTFVRTRHWRNLFFMTLVFALCGWIHPLSVIVILPGMLLLVVIHLRNMRLVQHIALALSTGVVIATVWPWVEPFWKIGQWFATAEHQMPLPAEGFDRVRIDLFTLQGPAALHRVLVVAALIGVVLLWRARRRGLALFFAAPPALLFALGYYGFSFGELQPARFIQVGYLWLAFAAGVAAQSLFEALRRKRRHWRTLAIAGVMLIASAPALASITERVLARPLLLIEEVHPEILKLIDWLKDNTSSEGRILFQDSDAHWQIEFNVTAGYIAGVTQRDFIGGPYPWGGPVDFLDNQLFGRDIQSITSDQLAHYLDLYNIHWIVAHTGIARALLDDNPQLVGAIADLSPAAQIYAVNQAGDYFLKGSGRVAANGNRIELYDLQGEEVILKYHWVPGLVSAPKVDITRTMIEPDPYGFIRITHPPERLTLWVDP